MHMTINSTAAPGEGCVPLLPVEKHSEGHRSALKLAKARLKSTVHTVLQIIMSSADIEALWCDGKQWQHQSCSNDSANPHRHPANCKS